MSTLSIHTFVLTLVLLKYLFHSEKPVILRFNGYASLTNISRFRFQIFESKIFQDSVLFLKLRKFVAFQKGTYLSKGHFFPHFLNMQWEFQFILKIANFLI